jgi:hypothetical protein
VTRSASLLRKLSSQVDRQLMLANRARASTIVSLRDQSVLKNQDAFQVVAVKTNNNLIFDISALRERLARIRAAPKGVIQVVRTWSGKVR